MPALHLQLEDRISRFDLFECLESYQYAARAPREQISTKPQASVSLDLDNQWSYMKTHGDASWKSFPSYFSIFVPHVLRELRRRDLVITFFIVGQDAALKKNEEYLRAIAEAGHEIGNHSFHHEPWLQFYSKAEIENEILRAEDEILRVTGVKPRGFRGPGFSWSPALLEALHANGYRYDASTLPTYLGPLARAYYFHSAKLSKEERQLRKELFGKFSDGLRPAQPYYWRLNAKDHLLEIPVTTMPLFKVPFHLSYLLYLSRISRALMRFYLRTAITLCRITNTAPSFLLHPLDLIGGDQARELAFFPGMEVASDRKLEVFDEVMSTLAEHFELVDMRTHAAAIARRQDVQVRAIEAAAASSRVLPTVNERSFSNVCKNLSSCSKHNSFGEMYSGTGEAPYQDDILRGARNAGTTSNHEDDDESRLCNTGATPRFREKR